MTIDLERRWAPYSALRDLTEIRQLIDRPVAMSKEQLEGLMPSIVMGEKGPALGSLYIRTQSLLSEVNLSGLSFDFVPLYSIFNYRVILGQMALQFAGDSSDAGPIMLDSATIILTHMADRVTSQITYVGSNREQWLSDLMEFVPLKTLSDSWSRTLRHS
jgi:hypothetical protein